jgi:hypothetical protein
MFSESNDEKTPYKIVITNRVHVIMYRMMRDNFLFRAPQLEIDLDRSVHRTGYVWHIELESVGPYTRYGYRCKVHGH